jgi:hypothetical protein
MLTFLPYFRGLTPPIRLEVVALLSMFDTLSRSNRVSPQSIAAYTRMKNADWLDVAACAAA